MNIILINWFSTYFKWTLVAYHVKNVPGRKSDAFDTYRQQDFERRKAEGFSPPLYKSLAPTPEATPEQQSIREAFWKDEDYIPDQEEAYFSIWKGLKSKITQKH